MNRKFIILGGTLCVLAFVLFVAGIILAVRGSESVPGGLIVTLIVCAALAEFVGMALLLRYVANSGSSATNVLHPNEASLYQDRLVRISESGLYFPLYYFPFGSRFVRFEQIERIESLPPSFKTGKWRQWGTNDFLTWFPCDLLRHRRERIFHIHLKGARDRIGFTVLDVAKAKSILSQSVGVVDRQSAD